MNLWAFLHYQCSRMPPLTVALLIFAGVICLGVVVCLAGKSAIAATVLGGVDGLLKKVVGNAAGAR